LHQWHKPFYEVWPEPAHIIVPAPEERIYWRSARPLPDGGLPAIYEGINQSPYGGGMVKVDKNSNLIWKLSLNAHHDFDVDADGNIYVLTHRFESEPVARINDYITILSPNGEEIETYSILDGFRKSEFSKWLPDEPEGDFLHTNTLEILTREKAAAFPMFAAGDLLVSYLKGSAVSAGGDSD
jgi:hypothetical protein